MVTLVCVESWLVLHATVRSALGAFITSTMTSCPTGNDCLAFLDGNVHRPDNVKVSENDVSADEPVSENLDSCTERSFLSQRQCRLIYQQLRNSDVCLEENFSALMHGNTMRPKINSNDFGFFWN